MVRRWRRLMIAGGMLLVAVAALCLSLPKKQPPVAFDLPNGTGMKLISVTYGKELRFHDGTFWQNILYGLCRTNLPVKLRGHETRISPLFDTDTNGSLGLEFQYFGKPGSRTLPSKCTFTLTQTATSNSQAIGHIRREINYGTSFIAHVGRVPNETIYWELPLSKDRELHFCLCYTDSITHSVSTNDFTIPNPSFK